MPQPFHLAFKVKDLASTKLFYCDVLGCRQGREAETWVDFDFFGHQLSAHVSDQIPPLDYCGHVDGVKVPIPHFGCLLSPDEFDGVRRRLEHAGIAFIVPPTLRYAGKTGEQRTLFVLDHSNNPIEFKSFSNDNDIFL